MPAPIMTQYDRGAGQDVQRARPTEDGRHTRDLHSAEISLEAARMGQALSRKFKAYGADLRRSLYQLLTTVAGFAVLLAAMAILLHDGYLLGFLLAIPAAGLLVRLFIIQHDCGHGSFFRSRRANDALGRALSILTLTPYGHWKQGHAIHHATSGNLDRRGRGDVEILTVAEYEAMSPLRRRGYRLYRNPLIMVLLGAPINFMLLQRIPRGQSYREREARYSILALNLALIAAFAPPMILFGVGPVLAIYLPVLIIASWIGNWLFFVQHQFDDTYWKRERDWNFHAAALLGGSYFELPTVLRWFSGNIGLHHVHHLCSRVPNYRLQACLDGAPELRHISKRITLRASLGCWRLTLWDEERHRMVRFDELKLQVA